jgi:iron complex transport system substrate-binding protein
MRLVMAALLAGLLAAPPVAALTLRDMLDREVTLPGSPRRIISLVPSITEIVFALGGEERLVGRTDFCDFPAAARGKPSVGGMVAPSLETIVALKPDLVIATMEGNRRSTFDQLTRLRIPVYLVQAHRVAEMRSAVTRMGMLTGREEAVGPLLARLDARISAVARAIAPFPRPRVLYVLWPEPLIVPGHEALVTELIELAGGQSITAGDGEAYPRYSLEAAVARAPEVILLADHGAGRGPHTGVAYEKWRRLRSLPAVQSGRLQSVDGTLVHRYGPRVVDGLEELARAIHPEAFR